MSKPTKIVINCETNIEEIVELTDAEIAQQEIDRVNHEKATKAREAEETAKAEAKASALAKLAKLGLTEDEAKAIVG
jgi:hypothetical protein